MEGRLTDSETNLMVCNGPLRSCDGAIVQHLQIQLFLVRAAVEAFLVRPEQERWTEVRQLLQVRVSILQAMMRLQPPQERCAG